ncbi:histidine kinase 5 [Nymphaea colorata]|nr:histidine kinase 5 [Nymphaea colorata]XP_049933461.1 histidine kinase 5 [Nymphaea colorata]
MGEDCPMEEDCPMGEDCLMEADLEVLPSMWPEDLGDDGGKLFNVEKPSLEQDMLQEVNIGDDPSIMDFKRLVELTKYSEKGSSQLSYLVKQWEYKQANVVKLLNEELDILSKQRCEAELKQLEILEDHQFEEDKSGHDKRPVSILEDDYSLWKTIPATKNDLVIDKRRIEIDAEYDTVKYWKQRALQLEKMLEDSIQREHRLKEKLQYIIENMEKKSSPVEELSQILKRADNFLHFILQTAPVVFGHQDKELRYRFIYNPFPSLQEQDVIGRTDVEIFSGEGVKENEDFKREVLERGIAGKREVTFHTELFGSKTFLIYVEPVFSKAGETIGINYMGMDITDQVKKREKMAKIREEMAVQKARETELNKTIHITEETMRAKQMLATMSHEIRSPLSGVVSMAEILANTKLDSDQRQLLDVMLSSGDLVLQLINDILDLSKVESGAMKLEATKFRPREVVKHVLQTAAASLRKELTLEGFVTPQVPIEVIGDVLRIRQILTNLITNAVKFTHEGKVGINLYVIPEHCSESVKERYQNSLNADQANIDSKATVSTASHGSQQASSYQIDKEDQSQHNGLSEGSRPSISNVPSLSDADKEKLHCPDGTIVWLGCDVYDTGIGIPEKALPTLFKKYMQVSADHARKYGGTGLGLAICKQLVELMGGKLSVTSHENCGSTFTFVLPCHVPQEEEVSDDTDNEIGGLPNHHTLSFSGMEEAKEGHFHFPPRVLLSVGGRMKPSPLNNNLTNTINATIGLPPVLTQPCSLNHGAREPALDDSCSLTNTSESFLDHEGSSERHLRLDSDDKNMTKSDDNVNDQRNSSCDTLSHEICEAPSSSKMMGLEECQKTHQSQEDEKSAKSCGTATVSTLEPKNSRSKPRILLVEDNKINVMVARSMMKQLGHHIDVVYNGLEAVHAVQSSEYDLVLMDVCMPVMDGLQAARLIRSFEETGKWDDTVVPKDEAKLPSSSVESHGPNSTTQCKRIPIIAMTANALAESPVECLANGMDSFVSKPMTFHKLKDCLDAFLPR